MCTKYFTGCSKCSFALGKKNYLVQSFYHFKIFAFTIFCHLHFSTLLEISQNMIFEGFNSLKIVINTFFIRHFGNTKLLGDKSGECDNEILIWCFSHSNYQLLDMYESYHCHNEGYCDVSNCFPQFGWWFLTNKLYTIQH